MKGMSFWCGILIILLPHFNCLVSFTSNKPWIRLVVRKCINTSFTIQWARLHNCLGLLKTAATLPVPEPQAPTVTSCSQHTLLIDGHWIDYSSMLREHVVAEFPFWKAKFLDVVSWCRRETLLSGMHCHCSYRLFMVGESRHCFSHSEVPELDGGVMGASDNLRVHSSSKHRANSVSMAGESKYLRPATNIPDPADRITPSGHQNVDGGMKRQAVNTTQMAVIRPDNLVLLKVPAFDLLVIASREHVCVFGADSKASYLFQVSCEREFLPSASRIPYLDCAICRAGAEPRIAWIKRNGCHPSQVPRDNSVDLPWRMKYRTRRFAWDSFHCSRRTWKYVSIPIYPGTGSLE